MKDTLRNKTKAMLSLVLSVLLCSVFAIFSFSAEDDFESKIAAFPESYKPYLRELHIAHPEWEFEPLFTYLDFNEAVDNECGVKSLVENSAASNVFKSKDAGDYDYTKKAYIYKDGGFVEANRLAVAYFMDPRNFLNADGIFQFETLSFNEDFTTSVIENILKGSFMYDKKITYLNSEGETVKTKTKYSKAIYNAGKKYNINPCFLASKILNEVGTAGSKSVTGDYSTYPGIYNFYNIGASDGKDAIGRGLKWASDTKEKTYSRPWNTPVKSIDGGAEFIVKTYIACGQFTGYLQRFNVNPDSKHSVYTHQYMTNLTGALSQGYSTYVSYVKSGILDSKIKFSIPVYENMPSDYGVSFYGHFVDSLNQSGKINVSASSVRTGPSTDYAKLLNDKKSEIKLSSGDTVTIIDKVDTDSNYFLSILKYPYWYKISFMHEDKNYLGYIPGDFVDITTQLSVGVGEYTPAISVGDSSVCMELVSYDSNIAQIMPGNKINFLKKGTVDIATYDSLGNYDKVRYSVSKTPVSAETKVNLSDVTPSSVIVNFNEIEDVYGYEIVAVDSVRNIIHKANVKSATPYKISSLNGSADYDIYVRAILDEPSKMKYGPYASSSLTTLPGTVSVSKVVKNSSDDITIHWKALSGITEYQIFTYDSSAKKYTKIGEVSSDILSFRIPSEYKNQNQFCVRAVETIGKSDLYGKYSKIINTENIPSKCSGTKVSSVTEDGYKMTWKTVEGAKYYIYRLEDSGDYEHYKSVSSPLYEVKKAGLSAYNKYMVSSYKKVSGIIYEGEPTRSFSATTIPAAVTKLKISATTKGGKLTWSAVDNARDYTVYIYSTSKKKYVEKATVKKNTYTLTDRKPGKTYKIQVKARIKSTYGNYYGDAATLTFYTKPEAVTKVKFSSIKTDSLNISWEKAPGTSRYYIYQYSSKKKKFVKIGETKKLTYSVSGLKSGTTYKFRVKSVKLVDGKSVSENTSADFKTSTTLLKPSEVTAKSNESYITLSWKKVRGATHYRVYKYDDKKKKYIRIKTVEGTTKYKVEGLKAGTKYKFKIRPLKDFEGKKYMGYYSEVYSFSTNS